MVEPVDSTRDSAVSGDRMPSATVTLTAFDGELRTLDVTLDDWEHARDDLARRAADRGWPGPYVIAPAPNQPAGVTVPGLALPSTTWQHIGPRWAGRSVVVRWEEPGGIGADRRTGRPIVLRGVVLAHPSGAWFLHTADGRVGVPVFAHVVDTPEGDPA